MRRSTLVLLGLSLAACRPSTSSDAAHATHATAEPGHPGAAGPAGGAAPERPDAAVLSAVAGPAGTRAEPWCDEHGVPEALCTKCRPGLVAKLIEAGDYCREHGYAESMCPLCNPGRAQAAGHEAPVFPPPGTIVRVASPDKARAAGIETAPVISRRAARTVTAVGRLVFDQNRYAELTSQGDGLVVDVSVDIGDEVRRGQPLVVLASGGVGEQQAKLAAAEARLRATLAWVAREESLVESGISSRRSLDEARAAAAAARAEHEEARAYLRAMGANAGGAGGRHALAAPFDGAVVGRRAVVGRSVAAGETLLEVADLSRLWAALDVPEEQASLVRPGQPVRLELEGTGGQRREGTIARLAAFVDARTRTVRARVELPNPDRALRAGTLLRAHIEIAGEHAGLYVPHDAVQHAQGRALVFVRAGETEFKPVAVELGPRAGGEVEVLAGLAAGAEVVTRGAFLLKTEVLADLLGAGCADD